MPGAGETAAPAQKQLSGSAEAATGIDGIIREDRLGLDVIYGQAKRWQNPISPRTVREGIGALEDAGTKKATTARFSAEAQQLADMASACG